MILVDFDIIERNASKIVARIEPASIHVYLFLADRFVATDIENDHVFQLLFRSYYRLDTAGLTPEFKAAYFRLMAKAKRKSESEVREFAKHLYKYPNRKGQKTLQYSFATKLANLVTPSTPIYDSEVASLLSFKPPSHKLSFEARLETYQEFLDGLSETYRAVIRKDLLPKTVFAFRRAFCDEASRIPNTKTLDFIFWAAGKVDLKARADA